MTDDAAPNRSALEAADRDLLSPSRAHVVQFYDDDKLLTDTVARFLIAGLAADEPLVVIATAEHRAAFRAALEAKAIDVERAVATNLLIELDAHETLASFMVEQMPDGDRFMQSVGAVIARMTTIRACKQVRAYGEMVDILWREGNTRAALRLEELWNELARHHAFSLLCAYAIGSFYKHEGEHGMRAICATHSHVLPSLAADVDALQERTRQLQHEVEGRRQLEAALREALQQQTAAQAQLESLLRIGRNLHGELELGRVVQMLTDEATALCRAQFGAFFSNVGDEKRESFTLAALTGVPREMFATFPMPRSDGIFAPTFRGERVMRFDDVTHDPRYGLKAPFYGMPAGHVPVRSYLAVPVLARSGEVIGGLFFGHAQPGVFGERDEALLVAIAAQAAVAIENAQLYAAEKFARALAETAQRRTAVLHAMSAELSRPIGPDEAAQIVIRETRNMIGAEAGGVLLLDETGRAIDRLLLEGGVDPDSAAQVRAVTLDVDMPICEAARSGTLIWVAGVDEIQRRYPHLEKLRSATGARTWGAVPIVFEGRTLGAIGFRQISERRLTNEEEQLLLAAGRQCGQAIERARLFDANIKARAEAERATRAKDEFLAMLGHELRNPLSPILTAVQLMRMRGEPSSAKEQDVIERQVTHLMHLVDDLLDISRITRGKVHLERQPTKLAALVAKAVEVASPLFEERGHYLDLSMPAEDLWLDADDTRLCQVLTNLLTNAAKYTAQAGRIKVIARRDRRDVEIRVEDNGMGISPDLLPHVFDLFVQGGRSVDRAQGGLGIGLALVRSLVTMHGGSVSVTSEGPNRGSQFSVRLPLIDAPTKTPVPDPQAERSLGQKSRISPQRILVVDDNEDAASLLGELLRSIGHEVSVAHDGPSALDVMTTFQPHVAILDIGLPVMDGYELATILRDRLGKAVRLMAVTGYGQEQDRIRAQAAGFDEHFVKPVGVAQLLAAIESIDVAR